MLSLTLETGMGTQVQSDNAGSVRRDDLHAVTGAFGFTGKYVTGKLLAKGKQVVNLTGSPERPDPFGGRVETRLFNFHDVKALTEALRGVEVLYNTYWVRFNHDRFTHVRAVRNTLVLFEAAKAAGVERVVHVSIVNADPASPLEYFSAKGQLEKALQSFGLCHAIVRPAVLFGPEDILINNIAWALRRFPVFGLFGDGSYHIRPVYVEDMAGLMTALGEGRDNTTVNALGPEDFTYRELVGTLMNILGKKRRLIELSPAMSYRAAWLIGKLVGDVLVTGEEIEALLADALHVPGAAATGTTRLTDWAREQGGRLGRRYHSELDRRIRPERAY